MKLQDELPHGVKVDGKYYRLKLDFRNVLDFMDVLARDDLFPGAKMYLALKRIMKRPPQQCEKLFLAVNELLFPEHDEKKREKITDYLQDADLIRAAFLQSYGINLYRDKLHWLEFIELMSCLPGGSRYADVLSIRVREIPPATQYNQKEREWLLKAKESCALKITDKERERIYREGVAKIFAGMLAMAKGGENNGI